MAKFQSRTGIDESKRMYAHAALQKRYNDEATQDLSNQLEGQINIMNFNHENLTRRQNADVKAYVKLLDDLKEFGMTTLPAMYKEYQEGVKDSKIGKGGPKEVVCPEGPAGDECRKKQQEKAEVGTEGKDPVENPPPEPEQEPKKGPEWDGRAPDAKVEPEDPKTKPGEGDGYTEPPAPKTPPKEPPPETTEKKSEKNVPQAVVPQAKSLQSFTSAGTIIPNYKSDYVEESEQIINGAAEADALVGGAFATNLDRQNLSAFNTELTRNKFRVNSYSDLVTLQNVGLRQAGTIDQTIGSRLSSDNRTIEARMSDGSVQRWRISDTEKLADQNPEYYHQAVRFLQADEEQRLLDLGLSARFIRTKLQPTYNEKVGAMVTRFNNAWTLTKVDNGIRAIETKVEHAFIDGVGDPTAIMTGGFKEIESLLRSTRHLPGGAQLYRKKALERRKALQTRLMELATLKGVTVNGKRLTGKDAGRWVNGKFANHLVQVPWLNGWRTQSEAFPNEFAEHILADELGDFYTEEYNEAKEERKQQATEKLKEIEQAVEINRGGDVEAEGYKSDLEIYKMKQLWIREYASDHPQLFTKIADKEAQLKGEGASLAWITNQIENTADDNGQWGRFSVRDALNAGVHPLAIKKAVETHGKHIIQEEGEFDLKEDDIKNPKQIVKAALEGNADLLITNKKGGQQFEKMLVEAYKDLDVLAWKLYSISQGTENQLSAAAAYEEAGNILSDKITSDNITQKTDPKTGEVIGTQPLGKYGVQGGLTFPWLQTKGQTAGERILQKQDLVNDARQTIETFSGQFDNVLLNVPLSGVPASYYQNDKLGNLNSYWYELAELVRQKNPSAKNNPTAFEIANAQAKLRGYDSTAGGGNIVVEPPIDWNQERNDSIREKLKQNGYGNINQRDTNTVNRSIESIGGIAPQQFRVSMSFQESGDNHMNIGGDDPSNPELGFYGTLWSNVVRIAPLIGEQVPATHDDFLNNTALQHKIFEYTNNQYIQEIAKMGVTDPYIAVRILAAAHHAGPRVFTEADQAGLPIWRSPTFGLREGTNDLSMRDYTQQVLDKYRAGGLSLEF